MPNRIFTLAILVLVIISGAAKAQKSLDVIPETIEINNCSIKLVFKTNHGAQQFAKTRGTVGTIANSLSNFIANGKELMAQPGFKELKKKLNQALREGRVEIIGTPTVSGTKVLLAYRFK